MLDLINKACGFAAIKHRFQKRRDTGLPYFVHVQRVAEIVEPYCKLDYNYTNIVAAAYLHDTIEDTNTTYDELAAEFNHTVANLVVELTNSAEGEALNGKDKDAYILNKMLKMSDEALLIKIGDRLDNCRDSKTRWTYLRRSVGILEDVQAKRKSFGIATKLLENAIDEVDVIAVR